MNCLPTRVLGYKFPFEVVHPTILLFRIPLKGFGCIYFVHVDKSSRTKLDPMALKCIFLGYSPTKKGYKCYHPATCKKSVSMDVNFHETIPFFSLMKSSLQGKCINDAGNVETSTSLPVPIPFFFDQGTTTRDDDGREELGEQREQQMQVYGRRLKKQ